MNNKYFALLGFLPDAERELKALVENHITNTVTWVSATDPNAEGIIINADFLGSPQIQKFIHQTRMNVVCGYFDDDGRQQATIAKIVGVNPQALNANDHHQWLLALGVDASDQRITASPTTSQHTEIKSPLSDQTATVAPVNHEQKPSNDYKDLLARIQKDPCYICAKTKTTITWIDTHRQKVYMNYGRNEIPAINNLVWVPADNVKVTKAFSQVNLDLWLFDTIWLADISDIEIDDHAYYRLKRWPRPLSAKGRSQALRLAAYAQREPVNVAYLEGKTGYSRAVARRFLFATLCTDQIRKVETSVELATKTQLSAREKANNTQKLSVLSRLRTKLGMT